MYKPDITKAQEGRLNKLLEKKVRFEGKIITRREFIQGELKKGYVPVVRTYPDDNKKARKIKEFHRLRNQESGSSYFTDDDTFTGKVTERHFGNANLPIVKKILALQDEIIEGYTASKYYLECTKDNTLWTLKKMEYDYAVRIMEQA